MDAFGITDLSDPENYLNAQFFLLAPAALAFFRSSRRPTP